MLALTSLLAEDGLLAQDFSTPAAPKQSHFGAKAKRVIFLFMSGGPSQVDTFDPKPELQKLHGQKLPASFGEVKTRRGVDKNLLLGSKRTFTKYGKSGIEVSDWLPQIGNCVDDLCVLRGCYGGTVHASRVGLHDELRFHRAGPACIGSWVTYGLGTENQNMPRSLSSPTPAVGSRAARRPGATATCRQPIRGRLSAAARPRC